MKSTKVTTLTQSVRSFLVDWNSPVRKGNDKEGAILNALQQGNGKQFGLLFNTHLWDIQQGWAVPEWDKQKGWSVLHMHTDHGTRCCTMQYVLKHL